MTHARWLVREVYADADDRGCVGVLRADPARYDRDEILAGGRVLGEVFRSPLGLYSWSSETLGMSGSTLEPDMTVCMRSMVESFDVQHKLELDAIDPLPESVQGDGFNPN